MRKSFQASSSSNSGILLVGSSSCSAPEGCVLETAADSDLFPEERVAIERVCRGICYLYRDGNPRRQRAFSFEHLGKLNPISGQHLQDLSTVWRRLVNLSRPATGIAVVGLSESGIVPSFAMWSAAKGLFRSDQIQWFVTSRTNKLGPSFLESHSHAPVHFVPLDLVSYACDEIWVVEDELTTGKTIENLLECLMRVMDFSVVRVFSLLDYRGHSERGNLLQWAKRRGVVLHEQSLLLRADQPDSDNQSYSDNQPDSDDRIAGNSSYLAGSRVSDEHLENIYLKSAIEGINFGNENTGRDVEVDESIRNIGQPIKFVKGDQMAEAILGLDQNPKMWIQQITRSPWKIDGRAVRKRDVVSEGYFLYNSNLCCTTNKDN